MYLVYASAEGEPMRMPPEIEVVVVNYPDLFEESKGVVEREVVHAIEIIPGSSILKGRIYRMSPAELDELRRELKYLIKKGWIRPSVSPYGSPVLFAPKKGGRLRTCIDYRGHNAITAKNSEPLPRINDLLDRVQGCRYFNKIDLKSGYHQIAIRPEDQHKTAFQTRYGLYEFVVMPFGLCNAPGTFQHVMNRIVHDYFVVVYLDGILIFSMTVEEHAAHVDEVLKQYDFEPLYIKGEYNKVADALSPRPDFLDALITEFGLADDVTRSLVEAYHEDLFMAKIMHRLEAKEKVTSDEFVLVDDLLFLEKGGNKREYEKALRRTILDRGESSRERCEDSLVEAVERLARVRETGPAWMQEEAVGRNMGDIWRGARGPEFMHWERENPGYRGRREEESWRPPRARPRMEDLDPSWYKPYDPTIDGPAEGPYFRRYDNRRVAYYDVNLGLESLYFNGKNVTGFVEKWERYAYRKKFSEKEWIDHFIQHSDPELNQAIRAVYPSDGRWKTFKSSLLRIFACDDMIPTIEGLQRVIREEQESLVAFTRRFKRLSQALVDRGMLSEVDRCVMFMLHLPEEKRREVLEKAPRDSANFERVAEVVFTGGGVGVWEYMKESLDMALRSMRSQKGDGPPGNERQPPGPPAQRWGGGPPGWRNEPGNQGNWRNDREAGGNRVSEWGNSRWKDARDGRWGDPPPPRAVGARPEVSQARTPPPPATTGAPPQVAPRPNNPLPRSGCVYCNEEGHIKRECPYLTEALRLGVVKLNENRWVVWGDDGEAVSFYPSMKVNVDKRMAL
ncbi:hypothetical protein CBR_g40247 [Chara braunii]|uniref:CCHC-type domain-containing protein n=1 Tax=Chara braunii TaxID=69332 RepID=A0A388K1S0_CHABU|nr:hypothetical protein CBR_g40247 [Chara braunii]|eukprot:GBG64002.1 hypothetical protein CBR_g40247 [Chara braunii]